MYRLAKTATVIATECQTQHSPSTQQMTGTATAGLSLDALLHKHTGVWMVADSTHATIPNRYACCWLKLGCKGCEFNMHRKHTPLSAYTNSRKHTSHKLHSAWPPCVPLMHVLSYCLQATTYHLGGGGWKPITRSCTSNVCANNSRPTQQTSKQQGMSHCNSFLPICRMHSRQKVHKCTEHWSTHCCDLLMAPAWFISQPCAAACVTASLLAWLWSPCGTIATSTAKMHS